MSIQGNPYASAKRTYDALMRQETEYCTTPSFDARVKRLMNSWKGSLGFYSLNAVHAGVNLTANIFRMTTHMWFNVPAQYLIIAAHVIILMFMYVSYRENANKTEIGKSLLNRSSDAEEQALVLRGQMPEFGEQLIRESRLRRAEAILGVVGAAVNIVTSVLVIYLAHNGKKIFPMSAHSTNLERLCMGLTFVSPALSLPFYVTAFIYALKGAHNHFKMKTACNTQLPLNNGFQEVFIKMLLLHNRWKELSVRALTMLATITAYSIRCTWSVCELLASSSKFDSDSTPDKWGKELKLVMIKAFLTMMSLVTLYGIGKMIGDCKRRNIKHRILHEDSRDDIKLPKLASVDVTYCLLVARESPEISQDFLRLFNTSPAAHNKLTNPDADPTLNAYRVAKQELGVLEEIS